MRDSSLAASLVVCMVGCPTEPPPVDAAAPLTDVARVDAATLDASSLDAATLDATTLDAAPSDAPPWDAARPTDASTLDARGLDAPGPGCACQTGAICQEASAAACPTYLPTCSGTRVASCPRDGVLYTCDGRLGGATYYSSYFFDDFAAFEASCESTAGNVLRVTPPPAPVGTVCSCVRTASACVEAYGTGCSSLACSPGVRLGEACPTAGALDAQCITTDGQRRYTFYGITSAMAQNACRAVTGAYWVPRT